MLKKFVLALMPLTLVASANADELDLDLSSIQDADISIVDGDMDIDVDGLSADAGEEAGEDAIEACFRRFGYRYGGWGGYRHWGGCYNRCISYCRPLYSYRTITYCPPVYRTVLTPVYSYYWGCH